MTGLLVVVGLAIDQLVEERMTGAMMEGDREIDQGRADDRTGIEAETHI